MNSQDQIKAIAKLDGWTLALHNQNPFGFAFKDRDAFNRPLWVELEGVPDYLHSRDAIVPVIEKHWDSMTEQEQEAFVEYTDQDGKQWDKWGWIYLLFTTPAQLREALLRATGNWKDD